MSWGPGLAVAAGRAWFLIFCPPGPACRAGHGSPALMNCGLLSDTPPVSPSDPAGWLRARVAELDRRGNARLRQAAADRDELAAAQLAARDAQIEALAARVEELQRLLGKDSSNVVQAAFLR